MAESRSGAAGTKRKATPKNSMKKTASKSTKKTTTAKRGRPAAKSSTRKSSK